MKRGDDLKKWKFIMAAIGAGLLGGVLTSCGTEDEEIHPVESFQQSRPSDETGNNEPGDNGIVIIDPQIFQSENNEPESNKTENSDIDSNKPGNRTVELVALADTEEQAVEIASLYQIELLSFSNGVAVYATDQDPSALIALGQQNGYPVLSVNEKLELH